MIKTISSGILFFFVVFVFLGILVSETTQAFSQLFFLLCKSKIAYSLMIKMLCFFIFIVGLFYLFVAHYREKEDFAKNILASCICIFFLFIFIYLVSLPEENYIDTLHFYSYRIAYLDFFSLLDLNFFEILVAGFFYIFLLLLPCVFLLFNWHFDIQKSLHNFALKFFPSINICIMVLIASAFQPYYDKANFYLYIDFFLFIIALVIMIVLFFKKKFLFDFYEYTNLLILIFLMLLVLSCSDILAKANYYNVRYCLYLIAFFSWCCEWMFGDLTKSENA
ncbi:hypothetical protein [Helicobacter anatolicus]|uniref:hypothetical protein n=1 Tax=Helicobacter anatolicus TaxID=2905874 RepID=UPI001E303F90|nr:hypothetical protein [Helicobacter anatolicus]MCE3039241.1 hypothetical protein [Helicobacter anatolicus]